ncbi:MAG: hypothetical protein AB2563_11500 [Candidatus Thiodiazotropha endolucinida]
MSNALSEYFEALERLKKGKSINLPPGTKISNDTVALEAGRGRGSIKKSRPVFGSLIKAINDAAAAQIQPRIDAKAMVAKHRDATEKYRRLWEDALARELSLIHEIHELKVELSKRQSSKVTSFTK